MRGGKAGTKAQFRVCRRVYGKTRDGVSCSVLRKVAAPWGRGDLGAVASGYSISDFAKGRQFPASVLRDAGNGKGRKVGIANEGRRGSRCEDASARRFGRL